MQNIKDIIDHLINQAKKSMRRNGGELEPKMYFLILYPGQQTPVYFPLPVAPFFESSEKKAMLPAFAQSAWNSKKASGPQGIELIAVCLITDTWQSPLSMDSNPSAEEVINAVKSATPPSKDPKRQEAIALTVCYQAEEVGYLQFYKRLGSKINYGELIGPKPRVGLNIGSLYPKNP